jgi:hypothetical protein
LAHNVALVFAHNWIIPIFSKRGICMQVLSSSQVISQTTPSQAKSQPAQASSPPSETPALKSDGLQITLDVKKTGKGFIGLVGGTLVVAMERGLPSNFGGYIAAGGLLVGGGAGAVGAITSAVFTNDPKTGALLGAATGAATGAAILGKSLGSKAAILGGAVGAVAGAAGGWASAKIRQ